MSSELVDEWVRKAEEDRGAARALDPEEFPNAVCFHCQQAAEKYLKALMLALGMTPPRVHDLLLIEGRIAERLPDLAEINEQLTFLNPFSVLVRYPGESADAGEARGALAALERARAFLVKRISSEGS